MSASHEKERSLTWSLRKAEGQAVFAVGALLLVGCGAATPVNWEDPRSGTYVTDEGPTKRVMVYRSPPPRLGQCVDAELLTLLGGDGVTQIKGTVSDGPDRGAFRYS